jgi:hypothetical protein
MAFTLITLPEKNKPGAFRISTVQMRKNAPWQLQICIPSAEFHLAFGEADAFDILLGTDADAGKMLLRPNEAGAFKPRRLKAAVVFRIPTMETTPQIAFRGEDPVRRTKGGEMVIELPGWAWEPGRWQEIRDARSVVQRQDAAAAKVTRRDVLDQVGKLKP